MDITVVLLVGATVVLLGGSFIGGIVKKKKQTASKENRQTANAFIPGRKMRKQEAALPVSPPVMAAPDSGQGGINDEAPAAKAEKELKAGGAGFNAMTIRMVITIVLLLAAVYIILSQKYDADSQKWAFGVVGTILGYWMRTEKG